MPRSTTTRSGERLARIDRGLELYQGLKTPPVFWPLLLSVKATGEGHIQYPEFALLKCDLLLALDRGDEAEPQFRAAYDVARAWDFVCPNCGPRRG